MENFKSLRESKIETMREKVEHIADYLGKPIEKGIKESVILFNASGFNTGGSCEGHSERGLPSPWVDFEAENRPRYKFVGQKETAEKIAEKYSLEIEEVLRGFSFDEKRDQIAQKANKELEEELDTRDYVRTEEYLIWKKQQDILLKRITSLLEEFYSQRTKPDSRLELKFARLFIDSPLYPKESGKRERLTDAEKEQVESMLPIFRKEMDDFAQFVSEKEL